MKLKKGDKVLWWDPSKLRRWEFAVTQGELPNKHGVPLDFTAHCPESGESRRFCQLDEDILMLASRSEWQPFFVRKLPQQVVAARIPGCAQPTYGLFDLEVAGWGWSPLEGVRRSVAKVPLRFWRHGPNPQDMDWCLKAEEQDVAPLDWCPPIPLWMQIRLRKADINEG